MDVDLYRLTSYKFMFALCIFDIPQLLAHAVTGVTTMWPNIWDPLLAKVVVFMREILDCTQRLNLLYNRFSINTAEKIVVHNITGKSVKTTEKTVVLERRVPSCD
jgi:hypothetical protein